MAQPFDPTDPLAAIRRLIPGLSLPGTPPPGAPPVGPGPIETAPPEPLPGAAPPAPGAPPPSPTGIPGIYGVGMGGPNPAPPPTAPTAPPPGKKRAQSLQDLSRQALLDEQAATTSAAQAEQAKGDLLAASHEQKGAELGAAASQQVAAQDAAQKRRDALVQQTTQEYQQLKQQNEEQTKIDPRRGWNNLSTFQQGAGLIGAALGGFFLPLGAQNPVLNKLDRIVAQDVENQKFEAQQKRERLGMQAQLWRQNFEVTGSAIAADSLAASQKYESLAKLAEAHAAQRESPTAKMEAQKMSAELQARSSMFHQKALNDLQERALQGAAIAETKRFHDASLAVETGKQNLDYSYRAMALAQGKAAASGKSAEDLSKRGIRRVEEQRIVNQDTGKPETRLVGKIAAIANDNDQGKQTASLVQHYDTLRSAAENFLVVQKEVGRTYESVGRNFGALSSPDQERVRAAHSAMIDAALAVKTDLGAGIGTQQTERELERLNEQFGKGPEGVLRANPAKFVETTMSSMKGAVNRAVAQHTNWSDVAEGRPWDDKPFAWETTKAAGPSKDEALKELRDQVSHDFVGYATGQLQGPARAAYEEKTARVKELEGDIASSQEDEAMRRSTAEWQHQQQLLGKSTDPNKVAREALRRILGK